LLSVRLTEKYLFNFGQYFVTNVTLLGVNLDLSHNEVEEIKEDNQSKIRNQAYNVLYR